MQSGLVDLEAHQEITSSSDSEAASSSSDAVACDYRYLSPPSDDLQCIVCWGVADEPHQHEDCGQVFCKECIAKEDQPCPNCKQEPASYCFDRQRSEAIAALRVKCANMNRDICCDWEGTYGTLKDHVSMCRFALVLCPNSCTDEEDRVKEIMRKDMNKHLKKDCPHRQFRCESCGLVANYSHVTQDHQKTCPMKLIWCPYAGCNLKIQRRRMRAHLEVCEHVLVQCKYAPFGCPSEVKQKDLLRHEAEAEKAHFRLALNAVVVAQDANSNLQRDSAKLLEKINELERNIQSAEDYIVNMEQRSTGEAENREVERIRNDFRLSYIEKETSKALEMLDVRTNNFTFKIADCQKEIDSERRFFTSQPFYTRRGGYHMVIEVFLKEVCDRVSIIARRVDGEFDNQIPLAFVGTITFTLLNQVFDGNHHQCALEVTAENNMVSGRRRAIPEFISQDACFNPDPLENRQFLMDDTLYFRIAAYESHLGNLIRCAT